MSLGHREDLEGVLALVRLSVELESPCNYGDAATGRQRNREAFRAHFGELESALEEWDAVVARGRAAPRALWGWFERSARDLGITEPPFAVGSLVDRLAILTIDRSRCWQLDSPYELHFEHFNDRLGGESFVSVHVEGERAARLPAEPATDLDRRRERAQRLIQAWFDGAQASDCAQQISDGRDSLLELKQQLKDRLVPPAQSTRMRFASDCPFCTEQAAAERARRHTRPSV